MERNYKLLTSSINPYECSLEELKEEIKKMTALKEEYFNVEQAIKIYINSCYGACASPFFECFNVNVAEATTLQGQDMIKFTQKILDIYFVKHWHTDIKTHKLLGLTKVKPIDTQSVIVYGDTDSVYITLQPVLDSCDWQGSPIDFVLKINDLKLKEYLGECFKIYAKKYNCENKQDLELEKVSHNALMIAKKKYILDLAWDDSGAFYEHLSNVKPTGIEIIQGSTPKYVRKVLKEMVNIILGKGDKLTLAEVIKHLKKYKQEYILQNPEDICKSMSIGDYEKYILEDKHCVKVADKCPVHNKAAAFYNNKLLNSEFKTKYDLLRTGDKCKFYYADNETGSFAFIPGNYPYEFAAKMNYDKQFETLIISPVNRYIEVLGLRPIPGNLIVAKSLF